MPAKRTQGGNRNISESVDLKREHSRAIRWIARILCLCFISASLLESLACQKRAPGANPTPTVQVQGGGPKLVDGECETIFNNWNTFAVANGGASPTFTLNPNDPNIVCYIDDYHWNNGNGSAPGAIGLQDATGALLGPWPAVGSPGQGGVANASWRATPPPPAVVLKANIQYTVIDTNLNTWSQNQQSQGLGFSRVWVRMGH